MVMLFRLSRAVCVGLAVIVLWLVAMERPMPAQAQTGSADFVLLSLAANTNWPIGPSIYVTNVVANQGSGAGNSFYTGIYLSIDSVITTSDVHVASLLSAVPAGASVTNVLVARVPSTVAPGWYFLGAIADFTQMAPEVHENNNSLGGPLVRLFPVTDLVITDVGMPRSAASGGFLFLTNIVQNIGATTLSDFTVGVYLSTDPTITVSDTLMKSLPVNGGLQGGASITNLTLVDLTNVPPRRYYLGRIVDSGNAVAEMNEANNAPPGSPIDVQVGVDQVMVGVSAPTLTNGLRAFITNAVANRGFAHSGPMFVSHYLSVDDVITTNDVRFGGTTIFSVGAGTATTNIAQVFPPDNLAAGTYFLGAIIDPQDGVAEIDEGNNTAVGRQVELVYGPDLACTFLAVSSSNVVGASSVTVTNLLQNIGVAPGPGIVQMNFYLSEDSTITRQDILLETVSFFGLPMTYALTNRTTVRVSGTVAPGVYYLGALLDPFEWLAEPKTNNSLAVPVRLTVEADLTVTGIATSMTNASHGGILRVFLDVQNLGTRPIGFPPPITGIFLSSDPEITTNDFRLGLVGSTFAAGETRSYDVTLPVTNSIPPGFYYLGAIADFQGRLFERIETNNTLPGPLVRIRSELDLAPTAVAGSAVAVLGANYRMTNRIANLGLDSSAPTTLAVYLSTDNLIDTNDWLLGQQFCGSASSGFGWQGITNFLVPANFAVGFYFLGGIVDPAGLVPERDELNNTFVGGIVEVRDPSLIELVQLTVNETNVAVRFSSVPGRYYVVESAATLSKPEEWMPLVDAVSILGTGGDVEALDIRGAAGGQRFYRARLLP
jgi:large repetitive protein